MSDLDFTVDEAACELMEEYISNTEDISIVIPSFPKATGD